MHLASQNVVEFVNRRVKGGKLSSESLKIACLLIPQVKISGREKNLISSNLGCFLTLRGCKLLSRRSLLVNHVNLESR